MTIIVHGAPYSTCTQRILTTLEELNVVDYKLEVVDLSKGAHKSPDFLKLQVSNRSIICMSRLTKLIRIALHCRSVGVLYSSVALGQCIPLDNGGSGIDLRLLCLSVQPFGQVPVLQDGDITLFGKTCGHSVTLYSTMCVLLADELELIFRVKRQPCETCDDRSTLFDLAMAAGAGMYTDV
jgi:hypothetical protein